jgi:methionyl-tRNA formyltransferase
VIEKVVSSKDKTVKENCFEEIRVLCEKHGIPFYERGKHPEVTSGISLALGWRWIIAGVDRLIVMHDSPLPKYRGFAPIIAMLLDGETRLGATAFWAVEEFDAGDIIRQQIVDVTYPIKIREAIDLLAPAFKELTQAIVKQFVETGELTSGPQDHSQATFSLWRDEQDYRLDWTRDAEYIKRFVDAVGEPYDGACTFIGEKKLRVLDGIVMPDVHVHDRKSHIGKMIYIRDGHPVIICGSGLFAITELVDETGKDMLPLKKFRSRFS